MFITVHQNILRLVYLPHLMKIQRQAPLPVVCYISLILTGDLTFFQTARRKFFDCICSVQSPGRKDRFFIQNAVGRA